MTNALVPRVLEHRSGENPDSFTAKYRAFRLVYYEEYCDVRSAIAREKQIKGWTRAKKDAMVRSINPQWRDFVSEWEGNTESSSSLMECFRLREGNSNPKSNRKVLRRKARLRMTKGFSHQRYRSVRATF